MRIESYCGLPGTGKTLHCVHRALKHYKQENKKYQFYAYLNYSGIEYIKNKVVDEIEYKNIFPHGKINNVYSTFPICLDKKLNIWSNKFHLDDMNGSFSFLPNSILIIDETQLFYDSDEYRNKNVNYQLSKIGQFCQSHRHFGINSIIWTSQNPNRIFKKGREVSVWYYKHKKSFNFFGLLPWSIGFATAYEDIEMYGKYIPKSLEERKRVDFEFKKDWWFYNRKKCYTAYDSRYLAPYNFDKPLLNRGTWEGPKMKVEEVILLFDLDKDKTIKISEQMENTPTAERKNIHDIIDRKL